MAILAPGTNAQFINGTGTNEGLSNQAIWANGQRATDNSFQLNGFDTANLFNGNTTSQVSSGRAVLNTGENFVSGGAIQTNTSVYDAIGNALPSPNPEAIQELKVNASMYDAQQGATSGAQISATTLSGTNQYHGQVFWVHQTNWLNAAPFSAAALAFITIAGNILRICLRGRAAASAARLESPRSHRSWFRFPRPKEPPSPVPSAQHSLRRPQEIRQSSSRLCPTLPACKMETQPIPSAPTTFTTSCLTRKIGAWTFNGSQEGTSSNLGYVGNRGRHGVVPIPFNQPQIATASSPINGEVASYGYQVFDTNGNNLTTEPFNTYDGVTQIYACLTLATV